MSSPKEVRQGVRGAADTLSIVHYNLSQLIMLVKYPESN